jgi:hypothetical protein
VRREKKVRREEGEGRSEELKIGVWGISVFPGGITGFVSGYRYRESA